MDIRQWSKEFITEFIEMYRSYPCLWRIKSPEYSDRNKRHNAYEKLCSKLIEIDPTATKEIVVKKNRFSKVKFPKGVEKN